VCDALAREVATERGARAEGNTATAVAVAAAVANRLRASETWSAKAWEVSAGLRVKDAELYCLWIQRAQAQVRLEQAYAPPAVTAASRLAHVEGLLEAERADFAARLLDASGAAEACDAAVAQLEGLELSWHRPRRCSYIP
jgi:hypothetical protein